VLELLKPRAKRLDEFVTLGWFFWSDAIEYDAAAVQKHLRAADMDGHLSAVEHAFETIENFAAPDLELVLRNTAESRGVKAASLIHAVRVVTTGKTVSPGLFDVLALLGRTRVHARFAAARRLMLTTGS